MQPNLQKREDIEAKSKYFRKPLDNKNNINL